jgi:hypothetical protein
MHRLFILFLGNKINLLFAFSFIDRWRECDWTEEVVPTIVDSTFLRLY